MPSHRLLRDLVALKEGLCGPPASKEAGRRLLALADRVFEASVNDDASFSLDQAELLG
jgi:hypothetical protein